MTTETKQTTADILFAEILELLLFKEETPENLKKAYMKAKQLERDRMIQFTLKCMFGDTYTDSK
jgi:hypothetical protein